MKSLKIHKRLIKSQVINRRTHNDMAKRKKKKDNDIQNITQNITNRSTPSPLKTRDETRRPEV